MKKAYFQLHLAVFLWGFTAILGKLIQVNELWLVWYRMLISTIALWIFLRIRKTLHLPDKKTFLKAIGIGVIICLHWLTLYGAIKVSNVSVAISCFSSLALFTALIDSLFNKKPIHLPELILSLAVIAGIFIIFSAQQFYLKGIVLSVVSALLAAVFTILNKRIYYTCDPASISVIELGSGFLFLSAVMPAYIYNGHHFAIPSTTDWIYLLILSTVCTSFAFTLGNYALQKLDAFTCSLTVNLEPVYAIVIAMLLFNENEMLNPGFYIGTLIILSSVIVHTVYKYRKRKSA